MKYIIMSINYNILNKIAEKCNINEVKILKFKIKQKKLKFCNSKLSEKYKTSDKIEILSKSFVDSKKYILDKIYNFMDDKHGNKFDITVNNKKKINITKNTYKSKNEWKQFINKTFLSENLENCEIKSLTYNLIFFCKIKSIKFI